MFNEEATLRSFLKRRSCKSIVKEINELLIVVGYDVHDEFQKILQYQNDLNQMKRACLLRLMKIVVVDAKQLLTAASRRKDEVFKLSQQYCALQCSTRDKKKPSTSVTSLASYKKR